VRRDEDISGTSKEDVFSNSAGPFALVGDIGRYVYMGWDLYTCFKITGCVVNFVQSLTIVDEEERSEIRKTGTGNVPLMLVEVDEMNVTCEASLYTKVG